MKLLLPVALLVLVLVPIQWENVCASGSDSESVQCREEERLALLHIKTSIHFPIHSLEGKWEGKECCRWERVTCHPITGHVTQLDLGLSLDEYSFDYEHGGILLNASMFVPLRQLRSLSLSGHGIHNCTHGAGFESWSNLTKLQMLDLSVNNLPTSIISSLAKVSSLRALYVHDNNMGEGSIDVAVKGLETWSNLTKLEILDLSHNYFVLSANDIGIRDLPINGFESWSNLTKLQMLDLSFNLLNINIISSLAKVSSLRALYLDSTMMEGNINVLIQELSVLNLEVFSLGDCFLNGSFLDLGHWSSLKALSLAFNDLNDTLSLEGLCQLKNLEELDLSQNNFNGNLPPCLGNLSSLKLVDLSYNQFQIKFPSSIFDRLVSLRYLSLSYNQFDGTLFMRSFWNHSNLEVLSLSTSSSHFRVEAVDLPFQLQILELANCILEVRPTFLYSQHKLRLLDLSNTNSTGPLSVLWLLENNMNLTQLNLNKNNFTGSLQLPFLTHEKLSILDISENHFDGELPTDISIKLPNLGFLNLSKNYFHGPLPLISISSLWALDLSFNSLADDIQKVLPRILSSPLSSLDLSNNQFYGSVPNNLNFSGKLLLLNDNNISGDIPLSICNIRLIVLDISNNKLNGVLPDCIGRAEISILKLSGNHLEGSLPLEMCTVRGLSRLDLSDNKLSGSIPTCINQSALEIVDFSQNNLTGNFPITWLNISNIYSLNIGRNHLSGELPIWMGNESTLVMLQARENLLEGPIPKQICQFKYLRILDLSHNNHNGEIPSCIIDIGSADGEFDYSDFKVAEAYATTMLVLYFTDFNFLLHVTHFVQLYGENPMNFGLELMSKGRLDFYLEEILQIQSIIDLSSNRLVGNIPEDIGRMNWLITLNLSNNHLSGAIPNSISNLHQLESLDLSHNSLTGEIPGQLTKLTSLESFSVAYNNLSGPTLRAEAQFSTFDNSSYEGNPNLCGPPLSKSCVSTMNTTQPSPLIQRYEGTDFLILFGSFSLFFVVSFWCFMAILYLKRNWRYALFTLVDQYGDMIYVKVVLSTRKIGAALTRRG